MKLYVSQPMRGKSRAEIEEARAAALAEFNKLYPDSACEVIDSIQNINDSHPPLYWLGRSLQMLSEAQIILMMPGWTEARGCVIEYSCALAYGITVCNLDDSGNTVELPATLKPATPAESNE